jgi:hypothetical protein
VTAYYVFAFLFMGVGILGILVGIPVALLNKGHDKELVHSGKFILKVGIALTVLAFAWPIALPVAVVIGIYLALRA